MVCLPDFSPLSHPNHPGHLSTHPPTGPLSSSLPCSIPPTPPQMNNPTFLPAFPSQLGTSSIIQQLPLVFFSMNVNLIKPGWFLHCPLKTTVLHFVSCWKAVFLLIHLPGSYVYYFFPQVFPIPIMHTNICLL